MLVDDGVNVYQRLIGCHIFRGSDFEEAEGWIVDDGNIGPNLISVQC